MIETESRADRPLSYEDLRRFLLLVVSMCLLTVVAVALAKIVSLFVVVLFLAMVLNPIVVWLEKRGLRRGLAVVLVMLGLVGIVIGLGFLVVPPMIDQVNELGQKAPQYRAGIEQQLHNITARFPMLRRPLHDFQTVDDLQGQLQAWFQKNGAGVGGQLLTQTIGFLGGLAYGVLALLLTTFVLSNPKPLVTGFLSVIPDRHREAAGRSLARMSDQMVGWTRATLINGVLTGVSTAILLWIIGVQPVLVFGVLSFFGEFVPNIGPVVASLPALFVAASMGTTKFLLTGAAILFVQQVESNLLVPFIMGRELELHPVTIVFFALGMGSLFGFAGAILAVPAAVLAKILVDEFYIKPNAVPVESLEKRSEILVQERQWPGDNADNDAVTA